MRAVALSASVAVLTGCGVLWSLDGLEGGHCTGGCDDSGSVVSGDDSGTADDGGGTDSSLASDAFDSAAGSLDTGVDGSGEGDAPACTPPATPNLDDCKALLAMPSAPVIDGILDCGVPLWDMPLAGWSGTGSVPAGAKAQIAAAWRANGLYLFVHVTGAGAHRYPAPAGDGQWCGDAVELFVDSNGTYSHPPAYDVPGTMQFILVAPSDAMTSATVGETFQDGNDQGAWSGKFVTVRTADGFDAEAFVQAADLGLGTWTLAASGHVGLDVAVDLGNSTQLPASCPLLGQFEIQKIVTDAACGKPACNVDEFCKPFLQ
jgi:hypothetical protein